MPTFDVRAVDAKGGGYAESARCCVRDIGSSCTGSAPLSELEVVLADCIDLWMSGQDPSPILQRHPRVADEVLQLLRIAQAVRTSGQLEDLPLRLHRSRKFREFCF